MNPSAPRNTLLWMAVAGTLFVFVFFIEPRLRKPTVGPQKILAALKISEVTSIQILPKGQLEIRADLTNGTWQLTRPFNYPARSDRVQELLAALESLTPATFSTAQELKNVRQADEKFGFEPPQKTLVVQQGTEQMFLHIGYRTAPGDQVFVQVVGVGDAYVVEAGLLALIPDGVDDWRDTRLVDLRQLAFDRLLVTNAGKPFELQHNPTNRLWRMLLPGWEPRADSGKVVEALRRLQSLRVQQFVSDDPKADLDSFGLQAPELSVALAKGTNSVLLLEFGKSPTNNTGLQFARRGDQNTVVTVSKEVLGKWAYELFRDRHLVTLTSPLDSIEVRGPDNFTLKLQTNGTWRVLPQGRSDFPADAALVQEFITNLTALQAAEFSKGVVTAPELPAWGLAPPSRQLILSAAVTNAESGSTNVIIAQLEFGTNQEDKVYARRTDESSLYTVRLADLGRLPWASWQLRERRIWHFTENDVARIVVHQDGKTREIVRKGTNSWTLAPGSIGIINDLAMDEVAHRLGELTAAVWVAGSDESRSGSGFTPDGHQLSVELKTGSRLAVEFGGTAPSGFPYARTVLEDQPWIFEFPWALYHQYVRAYLTIPDYIH